MAGAITKVSMDVLSFVKRPGSPGPAPRDNAYAQAAKAVQQNASAGSSVPPTDKSTDEGQNTAVASTVMASKPEFASKFSDASAEFEAELFASNSAAADTMSVDDSASTQAILVEGGDLEIQALVVAKGDVEGVVALADGLANVVDARSARGEVSMRREQILSVDEDQPGLAAELPVGLLSADAAIKQAAVELSNADTESSDIAVTDNRGGVALENQIDRKSQGITAVAATRGDASITVGGKITTDVNVGAEATADLAKQAERSVGGTVSLDQLRSTVAEPSLRGSAEGKLSMSDGPAMAKLLFTEMQSSDTRSTASSVNDASPLAPLGQSSNPIAVKSPVGLVELALPTRLGEPGWQEGLSGRVSMMVNQRIGVATIRMNPPELGPIEVKVNLNNDQASVQFVSQAVQVRDALEQSIPRLREMLEESGFTLVDSQVSDQPQQQQQQQQKARGQGDAAAVSSELAAQTSEQLAVGLIDYYA
ncbi:MAG: flagellar hook-length control protein FliK [Candidatus Azotimanducaceae bacterium]|jgi:flagellar hook-length control protein FliK